MPGPTPSSSLVPPTARERDELATAEAADRPVIVFVHGLWLLAGSWDRWREKFAAAGYATVAVEWPDDPPTVEEGRAHPERFAGKSVEAIAAHVAEVIHQLGTKPAVVGHSFGGLITQQLAGQGLAAASVAIDPAPFRGVLPLPRSSLRAAWPVIGNPWNYRRSVMLTYQQFRYAFANTLDDGEARALYDAFPVPGSGVPLFQTAAANLNPRSETRVDANNPERGPMKLLSGEKDNTVPWAVTNASYNKQRRNGGVTEVQELPGRGHSLVIDQGWEEVADVALNFLQRNRSDGR